MPPVADFTATPLAGLASLSVVFTDTTTNTPLTRTWSFGDGHTSALQNPTHVYDQAGQYTVTLVAANGTGTDTMIKVLYISVGVPNIYGVPTSIRNGMTVVEQRMFNYYFLAGPQNKDISYSDGLDSNITITTIPTVHMHTFASYTPWVALHVYTAGNLVSYNGQDYICRTSHTSTSTFDPTKFSADNADVTYDIYNPALYDVKNIKTHMMVVSMLQNPVLGLVVTGPTPPGTLINSAISNQKLMSDTLYIDLIKMTYHRVKSVTSFNI